MVTGIETAGLVLGAFPIVIEGLKYYISSARKVKEISRYKDVLRQFMRDIETEMTIFEDTWYQLTGCDPFESTASGFPDLLLPMHPRTNSIDSIGIVCENMKKVLEGLQKKFQKYEQKEAGYWKMLQVTFSLSEEYRKEQLALIRRYNIQFRELVTGAKPATTASTSSTKVVNVAKSYHKVRENAVTLYNVLKEKLLSATCSCQAPHSVGLQLQLRVSGVKKVETEDLDSGSLHRFTLVFPVSADRDMPQKTLPWRELEFEGARLASDEFSASTPPDMTKIEAESTVTVLVENSVATSLFHRVQFDQSTRGSSARGTSPMLGFLNATPSSVASGPRRVTFAARERQRSMTTACRVSKASPSTAIIACLCTAIRNAGALHECLRVLVSADNRSHRLWIPERPGCIHFSRSAKAVTLAEILCLPPPPTKERLKLGVKLASSVMQLHKTQWLGERWSKQDITFIIPAETCTPRSLLIENPLLHQNFVLPNTPPLEPENCNQASIFPCNPSLYSLGIVLIELWHWKDFQCLQRSISTDLATGQDTRPGFFTAFKLAKEIYDEAGERYGEAVRRCIQGLDTWETSLEKEEFKNKVYAEIVRPLEDNLAIFTGKPLTDIFDKGAL